MFFYIVEDGSELMAVLSDLPVSEFRGQVVGPILDLIKVPEEDVGYIRTAIRVAPGIRETLQRLALKAWGAGSAYQGQGQCLLG